MKTRVLGMTALNLVEITRKKSRQGLHQVQFSPCDVCGGTGYLYSPESVAIQIIRRLRDMVHAADLAKGIPGAQAWDDTMSKARVDVDFDTMIKLAIDPVKARTYYESSKPECEGTCTMCGKMCPARNMKRILAGEDITLNED